MGKASNRKKQQRGQGTRRQPPPAPNRLPLAFLAVAAAAFLGVLLLMAGGNDSAAPPNPDDTPAADRPAIGDHWHAAIGFYVCGEWVGPFKEAKPDTLGIHSHGDGLIHVHPFIEEATGKNATLDKFMDDIGAELSATRLALPDGTVHKNGDTCGDQPGLLTVVTWDSVEDTSPHVVTGNPAKLRLRDGLLITAAFVPDGTNVPQPPSAEELQAPRDLQPAP